MIGFEFWPNILHFFIRELQLCRSCSGLTSIGLLSIPKENCCIVRHIARINTLLKNKSSRSKRATMINNA